nr:MAG TPA: hypothetical protein [Caudoviricetes sp.]
MEDLPLKPSTIRAKRKQKKYQNVEIRGIKK